MDSDDDFETGLPKVPQDDPTVVSMNLRELMAGNAQEVFFDAPEVLETEGHKTKSSSVAGETVIKGATYEQMALPFLAGANDHETLKVMFGDYSEVEPLMKSITEDGMVKKRVLRPGTGKKVIEGNMVAIHYMMGSEEMDDLIESTYESRRLRRFRVGAGEVLPVMDIGVATMRVGEMAKFLATCEYGYGKLGVPLEKNVVPPGSRVMLQIEVVDTYSYEKDDSIARMSQADRLQLPFDKLFTYAEEMKKEGNREFKDKEYDKATTYYLEALEAIKDMEPFGLEEKSKYYKLRNQVCNNLAHVYFKMGKYNRALKYAEGGVEVPVGEMLKAKSHYWCAKAHYEMGRYEQCLRHIQKADVARDDREIKDLRQRAEIKIKVAKEKEKELCARMMSTKI